MDPLSVTASIIAVLQLSSNVLSYMINIKHATKEQRKLRDEIRRCETILLQLKDNSEDSASDGDNLEWRSKIKAIEGAPLSRITSVLKELEAKLKPEDGMKKVTAVLKWPFTKAEVAELTQAMSREMQLLQLALSVDTSKLLQKIQQSSVENQQLLQTVRGSTEAVSDQQAMMKKDKILNWLSPGSPMQRYNDIICRKQAGTGQWFLESPEVASWVEAKGEVLFCSGMPGVGKSYLVSILVEHLLQLHHNSGDKDIVGIAHIYFDYKTTDAWDVKSLLSSLLRQLSQPFNALPEALVKLHDRYKMSDTRPPIEAVLDVLRSVLKILKRAFVLVDAVDECPALDSCRKDFITQLLDLSSSAGLNVLATSRDIPDVRELFVGLKTLRINARDADIRRLIDGRMSQLSKYVRESSELRQKTVDLITKSANEIFLLARLHLDSLGPEHILTKKQAHAALANLPDNYDLAYRDAMERIERQSPARSRLAKRTLSWIVHAKRPLTKPELQEAVAMEPGDTAIDQDDVPHISDIVSVCAGLLRTDDGSDTVRLIHYTAQVYFENARSLLFPNIEAHIARCLTSYLAFPAFKGKLYHPKRLTVVREYTTLLSWKTCVAPDPKDPHADLLAIETYPLYAYAAKYWPQHTRIGLPDTQEATSFLSSQPQIANGSLLLFAKEGPEETVQWLVELGVDPNIVDFMTFKTPLHWAVRHEWVGCVKTLLDHGARLDLSSNILTPLHWSVYYGNTDIILTFLKAGIPVDLSFKSEVQTATYTFNDNTAVPSPELRAEMEAERGAVTSLHVAAFMGRADIVEFLLANGASKTALSESGETPLHWALKGNYRVGLPEGLVDVAERTFFLQWTFINLFFHVNEANIDVNKNRMFVVGILLGEKHVNVHTQDKHGNYPMHCIQYGHDNTSAPSKYIWELFEFGADVFVRNNKGQTPLHLACLAGNSWAVEMLHFLVPEGQSYDFVEARDNEGRNALHYLLGRRVPVDASLVSALLLYGVNVNDRDSQGLSPLAKYLKRHPLDADDSEMQIIQLLLDHGADPMVTSTEHGFGLSHLYATAYHVNVEVLKTLAAVGVDLQRTDNLGQTLLHHLIFRGSATPDILDYLCNVVGLSKSTKDNNGRTALDCAVYTRERSNPKEPHWERRTTTEKLLSGSDHLSS